MDGANTTVVFLYLYARDQLGMALVEFLPIYVAMAVAASIGALIFGVLTMTTSVLLVSEAIKETLWWDFKVNKTLAWAAAVFVPYALYLCGIRSLTEVISLAGGVAGGLSAIMLLFIFRNMKKQEQNLQIFKWHVPNYLLYFFISLFILGMGYEIYYFLFK